MARIPEHIIDEIIQTARIEEVIGEFVHLKKRGANYMGLSPFTDEKTPSFSVSPSKQIFKCFSTGKGGSVVTFLMEKEHYSYPEALRWLADKYSIQLPKEEEQTPEQLAKFTERESLQIINEFAKNHFMQTLHETQEGKAIGLSYFLERGFTKDIIEKFQLGYCLDSGHDFTDVSKSKGYNLEFCEKVGLVKSKEGRYFDFFKGRVIFPIHSITGRVLGFGGRILTNEKKVAKYFNSPESIIYNKSEILYGLYFAKGNIIKYDNCFLVEGYTDVISLNQAGVTNVVSSSGTSLTKEQIKLIRRYTQNITILYDGDSAGIKASFRGIDLILEEGMNVQIVLFPDGDDPDSYSKKVSTTELERYIKENTKDFITFKAELLLNDGGQDPILRVKLIHDIIHSISLIPDQISRSIYAKEIASRFDIDEHIIALELSKIRKREINKQIKQPETANSDTNEEFTNLLEKKPPLEKEVEKNETNYEEFNLIQALVKYGTYLIDVEHINEKGETELIHTSVSELIIHELNRDELFFEDLLCAKIYDIINEGINNKTVYKSSYFIKHEDQEIVKFVSAIETDAYELSHNWLARHKIETKTELDNLKAHILNSIYAFKMRKINNRIQQIDQETIKHENSENFVELQDLIVEKMLLQKVKQELAKELTRIISP